MAKVVAELERKLTNPSSRPCAQLNKATRTDRPRAKVDWDQTIRKT